MGVGAINQAVNGAQEYQPESNPPAPPWPDSLEREAHHGPVGDFLSVVGPHTEADPAALLLQFLAMFGCMVGRHAYRLAEGARHHAVIWPVLVGRTAKGRKGSAWAQVLRLFKLVDTGFCDSNIESGLSSGEGLIWAVRDQIASRLPMKEETDPGVADKRLLVIEPEFASVLKVCERERNTLSATLRQAWDFGDLRTLTKNSPAKATDAGITVIGHITRDELLRLLNRTDAANGFANRFLWTCAQRSKILPFGGSLRDIDLEALAYRVRQVAARAQEVSEMGFTTEATALWCQVYESLTADRLGLLGAVLARAEAQVLRLAMLYALLDGSGEIRVEHLKAALAVWEYCEASAECVFGDTLGDPDADAILSALRTNPAGLSRTQIRDLFSRNLSAERIERALLTLTKAGLARFEPHSTHGRPAQIWVAVNTTKTT